MKVLAGLTKIQIHPTDRRIGLNASWLMISRLSSQSLGILFTMLVARSLGVAGYGSFSWILAVIFIANILTSFGTDTYLIREGINNKPETTSTVINVFWLQFFISMGVIVFLWIYTFYLRSWGRETIDALRIYSLALIPLAVYSVVSAVLRANERMDQLFGLTLAISGMQIAGGLILYRLNSDLYGWAGLLLIVQTGGAILAILLWRRQLSFIVSWRIYPEVLRRIVLTCWPLALLGVSSLLFQRIEIFILANLSGVTALGQYAAAAKVVDSMKILHFSMVGALFPAVAKVANSTWTGATASIPAVQIGRSPYNLMLILVLLICFGVTVFASPLVVFLFGSDFITSVSILRVIIWILVPYSFSALLSVRLVVIREEKGVLMFNLITLFVTILISAVLIMHFGVIGAGLGALAGECLLASLLSWFWKGRSNQYELANKRATPF